MSDEIIIDPINPSPTTETETTITEPVVEQPVEIPQEPKLEEIIPPTEPAKEDILETTTFNETVAQEKVETLTPIKTTYETLPVPEIKPIEIPPAIPQVAVEPVPKIEEQPVVKQEPPQEISQTTKDNIIREFLAGIMNKARLATQTKKKKNLELTMALFDTHMSITNDLVEKSLKISDSSARTYLNRLEKDGKILQHGSKGRGVFYTKI